MTLGIAILWSTSPLFYRAIGDTPAVEVVFYRSLFLALGVSLFVVSRYRASTARVVRSIGLPGALAALCLAGASLCFVSAVNHTTIAVLSFTLGATPFFAAILAWLALREHVSVATMVAMLMALAGIVIMVLEGLAIGTLIGNVLALGAAVCSAAYAVSLRYGRSVDQVPSVMVSGFFGMILMAPLVSDFRIPLWDLSMCAIQGFFISAMCNSLFTICIRNVPAAEVTLLSLLEVVLAPVGAWLVFSEIPSSWTVAGGSVLLLAVLGHAVVATSGLRARRRSPSA